MSNNLILIITSEKYLYFEFREAVLCSCSDLIPKAVFHRCSRE